MSSNNDNAMARFLFAILQQLDLKKINWDEVAHNSVLAQEITNGHAARMRYSRFKNSVLGIESQRRNRTGTNKSKVVKPKKEVKMKREKLERAIKLDPNATPDAQQETSEDVSLEVKDEPTDKNEAIVKKESEQTQSDALPTPAEILPVSMPDNQMQFHNRLLTPCSDTDIFAATHRFATSPVNEMLHNHEQSPFDYAGTTHCQVTADQMSSPWHPSPSYTHFQFQPYECSTTPPVFCDHQNTIAQQEGFGIAPSAMMVPGHSQVPVKQEDCNTRFC